MGELARESRFLVASSKRLRLGLAGSLLAIFSPSANAQLPSLGHEPILMRAFAEARHLVGYAVEERRRKRDAVLSAWINATPPGEERVIVRCFGQSCPQEEKEQILYDLAEHFERTPTFLKSSGLKQVLWNKLASGDRPDGMGKDGRLALFVPPDAPVDRIIVHELAHLYFEVNAPATGQFLALRFHTEEMRRQIIELIKYLEETGQTGCGPERPECLDDRARSLIAKARIPQRFPDDLHAVPSDTGYWASSIELAFRAWRGDGDSYLTNYFNGEEISWLLNKLGVYPPTLRLSSG